MEGALGAIAGLVGAGLSYSAQQTANVVNMMNLQFQKQQAAKQLQFAQAGRQDQFGNETTFNDALNKWIMTLTPTQNQISKAGEREQLLSLTVDAKRNRAIQEAAHQRGLAAVPDYNRVMADWRYNQPKSEMAITDELTNLLSGIQQEKAGKNKSDLIRQALRQNQGGNIATIIKGVNDDAGSTMAETMLKARGGAQQEFQARTQAHNENDLPVLSQLQQIMDAGGGGGGGGVGYNPGQALGQMQLQGSNAMQAAVKGGATNVGAAFKALAASEAKSPNFAGIAKSLGGKNQGQGQPDYSMLGAGDDPYGLSDLNIDRFVGGSGDF